MDSLASELLAHQRGAGRRPALALTLLNSRLGGPRLAWEEIYSGEAAGDLVAAAVDGEGTLWRVVNTGSEVLVSHVEDPGPDNGGDLEDTTVLADADVYADGGVAVACLSSEVLAAYVLVSGGTYSVVARSSTDGGETWGAPVTVLSGATVVDFIGLAGPNGVNTDTALFYATAGDDEVWHRRRTSGSWAVSSTNWNRQSSVAAITGLAAGHNGLDFILAITGTAETTLAPSVWALRVGDFDFTPDGYSTLREVVSVDGASSSAFSAPTIGSTATHPVVGFLWEETGDVAAVRMYLSHGMTLQPTSGTWVQPWPSPATDAAAAFCLAPDGSAAYLVSGGQAWQAFLPGPADLSALLVSAEWSYGPASTRARFVLDNTAGTIEDPRVGMDLQLFAGYGSGTGGAGQYGSARLFHIERVESAFLRDGRRTVTAWASGPWEAAGRWHTPLTQAFGEGAATREELFQYIAGRAGVAVQGDAEGGWDTTSPAFLMPAGETARSALLRLMAPIAGVINQEAGSFAVGDLAEESSQHYGEVLEGGMPVVSAVVVEVAPEVNWLRVQGPDRYADEVDDASVGAHGPRFGVLRLNSATSDELAGDYAAAALERELLQVASLRITAPYHAGQRLWDLVTVVVPEIGVSGYYQVIGLENVYARGPREGRYETTLTLRWLPGLGEVNPL